MERIGFTGTAKGATEEQKRTFTRELLRKDAGQFHHGDCVGADAAAHDIVITLGWEVVIHPPINNRKRAFKKAGIVLPAKPYLERNHDIVDQTNTLYAVPKGFEEELRSGTWATIRYARKLKRGIVIFWPNGSTTTEAYDNSRNR